MATYASLTQEQKDILSAWERNTRGWFNGLSRQITEARALKASLDASGGAGVILDSLDIGEIIPNSSGIAGAHDLTKENWALLRSAGINAFLTEYDTTQVREVLAKANGPTAGL